MNFICELAEVTVKRHRLHVVFGRSPIQVLTPGGGELPYESDGDARRKIRINTLKETNLGVAPGNR